MLRNKNSKIQLYISYLSQEFKKFKNKQANQSVG